MAQKASGSAAHGDPAYPPPLLHKSSDSQHSSHPHGDHGEKQAIRDRLRLLTPSACLVLGLYASDFTTQRICQKLAITDDTVRYHRGRIKALLKLDSFQQAIDLVMAADISWFRRHTTAMTHVSSPHKPRN